MTPGAIQAPCQPQNLLLAPCLEDRRQVCCPAGMEMSRTPGWPLSKWGNYSSAGITNVSSARDPLLPPGKKGTKPVTVGP